MMRMALVTFAIAAATGPVATGQEFTTKPPAAADWAALAKLPDFTGVWETGPGGGRGAGGASSAAARGGGRTAGGGANGRGAAPQGPALTPEYAAKRQARIDLKAEDNPSANCLPAGMPGIMGQPYPMEFLLTPGQVTIVIEAYQQVRHIYTDGRPLPADPDPKFHGSSVGRWEGATLVVDTVGFSTKTLLAPNTPHSDKMKIVERFRLTDPDTMSIETTITDPDALTAPFVSTRTLRRHRDWTIAEYICEENNRNSVDERGKADVNLDNPAGGPSKK
jgi:hypothetical protein